MQEFQDEDDDGETENAPLSAQATIPHPIAQTRTRGEAGSTVTAIKEGRLEKLSPAFFSGWQSRYCVLSLEGLRYFDMSNSVRGKSLGHIPLAGILRVESHGAEIHVVAMCGRWKGDRLYKLRAPSAQEAKEWAEAFDTALTSRATATHGETVAGEASEDGEGGMSSKRISDARLWRIHVPAAEFARRLVSKKKTRFQESGYDLDLSYITGNIIGMGFPADGLESTYRNPIDEVERFFKERHDGKAKLFNLCDERHYDPKVFDNAVIRFGFRDHNPPPIALLIDVCEAIHAHLQAHGAAAVAAVHCKAGKGRTGTVIAAYLMRSGEYADPETALAFFGKQRTANGKGVTIPSQMRYVRYYAKLLAAATAASTPLAPPPPRPVVLVGLKLSHAPQFDPLGGCDPYVVVHTQSWMREGPPQEGAEALRNDRFKFDLVLDSRETAPPVKVTQGEVDLSHVFGGQGLRVDGDFRIQLWDYDASSADDLMVRANGASEREPPTRAEKCAHPFQSLRSAPSRSTRRCCPRPAR